MGKQIVEFPMLQAGSLRFGFTVIYGGQIRRIQSVNKKQWTIDIVFDDQSRAIELNEKLFEIVATKINRKAGRNGKHRIQRKKDRK